MVAATGREPYQAAHARAGSGVAASTSAPPPKAPCSPPRPAPTLARSAAFSVRARCWSNSLRLKKSAASLAMARPSSTPPRPAPASSQLTPPSTACVGAAGSGLGRRFVRVARNGSTTCNEQRRAGACRGAGKGARPPHLRRQRWAGGGGVAAAAAAAAPRRRRSGSRPHGVAARKAAAQGALLPAGPRAAHAGRMNKPRTPCCRICATRA